ncbi:hypothetical protein EGW08_001941, partial [Elysia chlorotica]
VVKENNATLNFLHQFTQFPRLFSEPFGERRSASFTFCSHFLCKDIPTSHNQYGVFADKVSTKKHFKGSQDCVVLFCVPRAVTEHEQQRVVTPGTRRHNLLQTSDGSLNVVLPVEPRVTHARSVYDLDVSTSDLSGLNTDRCSDRGSVRPALKGRPAEDGVSSCAFPCASFSQQTHVEGGACHH